MEVLASQEFACLKDACCGDEGDKMDASTYTRSDKISNKIIREKVGITSMAENMRKVRLK